jgi:hypothetical protein
MSTTVGAYGPNSAQVESLLDQLRALPPRDWPRLDAAYRELDIDKFEDALAAALDKNGSRDEWFALRHVATDIARAKAREYATEVGEPRRTLEYVKAVNAWDGQREMAYEESLPPIEERAFIDAACGACGVVFMRPFASQPAYAAFWTPFASVVAGGDA